MKPIAAPLIRPGITADNRPVLYRGDAVDPYWKGPKQKSEAAAWAAAQYKAALGARIEAIRNRHGF